MATSPINFVTFAPDVDGRAAARRDAVAVSAELEEAGPMAALRWALERFDPGRVVVATALQVEGLAIVDMALRIDREVRILTVDTGRLPQDTLSFLDRVRAHYRRDIEVIRPAPAHVVEFVSANGPEAFYKSAELRAECCRIRKVEPLRAALTDADCWVSGLRRVHSETRMDTRVVEIDWTNGGIVKLNPLAPWSDGDAEEYCYEHAVPVHPLYGQGYRSIGCAPCTRAVRPGEPARSGRWWWEQGIDSECGIHQRP